MAHPDPEDLHGGGQQSPAPPLPLPLRWACHLAEIVGGVALLALMGLTVSDALLRTFANRPILGGGDLVQVFLLIVVACAIPLCVAAGRAIAIEIFVRLLPALLHRIVERATALISAAILLYLAWRCHVNAGDAALFGETTMLLRIPFGPFYTVLAVAFLLSALLFLVEALRGRVRA